MRRPFSLTVMPGLDPGIQAGRTGGESAADPRVMPAGDNECG